MTVDIIVQEALQKWQHLNSLIQLLIYFVPYSAARFVTHDYYHFEPDAVLNLLEKQF